MADTIKLCGNRVTLKENYEIWVEFGIFILFMVHALTLADDHSPFFNQQNISIIIIDYNTRIQ